MAVGACSGKGTPKTNAALTKLDDVPVEFIGEELLKELKGPIKAAAKRPGRRHHAGVRTVVVFLPAMGTNGIKFPDVFPFWGTPRAVEGGPKPAPGWPCAGGD